MSYYIPPEQRRQYDPFRQLAEQLSRGATVSQIQELTSLQPPFQRPPPQQRPPFRPLPSQGQGNAQGHREVYIREWGTIQ
jgi:hypothetical protein